MKNLKQYNKLLITPFHRSNNFNRKFDLYFFLLYFNSFYTNFKSKKDQKIEDLMAYENEDVFPSTALRKKSIYIDFQNNVIILPILRISVLFHISVVESLKKFTIKNEHSLQVNLEHYFQKYHTKTRNSFAKNSNILPSIFIFLSRI